LNARMMFYAAILLVILGTFMQSLLPTLNPCIATVMFLLGTVHVVLLFFRPHTRIFNVSVQWRDGLTLGASLLLLASVLMGAFITDFHAFRTLQSLVLLVYAFVGASQEVAPRIRKSDGIQ